MGKHITEQERYQIEILLKSKKKPCEIAALIGKCVRTIYYEINRGKTEQLTTHLEKAITYKADAAQRIYREHKRENGRTLKIGNDMQFVRYIEKSIGEEHYSPYAALQRARNEGMEFRTNICTKTLYNYIDAGLFLNISNASLPKKKQGKKREYKRTVPLNNLKGESIEKRPEEIRERNLYGHWEMDTVVSGQGKGKTCLLVLSERMTREEVIRKIPNKKATSVISALDRIERKMGARLFRETFRTITCDNGCEFLNFAGLEKSCINRKMPRTKTYFCHPYSSWERGTNENQNGMIRRFIPKGADIGEYSEEDIAYIEHWMNTYPRKILEGKSSFQYKEEKARRPDNRPSLGRRSSTPFCHAGKHHGKNG